MFADKASIENRPASGILELITSRAIIVFKYQVGRTMAGPDKRREQKTITVWLKEDIK